MHRPLSPAARTSSLTSGHSSSLANFHSATASICTDQLFFVSFPSGALVNPPSPSFSSPAPRVFIICVKPLTAVVASLPTSPRATLSLAEARGAVSTGVRR